MTNGVNQYTSSAIAAATTTPGDRLAKMFAKMDSNGDGYIDKAEFTAFHQQHAHKNHAGESADDIFAKIDTNGDGKISQDELSAFQAVMKSKRQATLSAATSSQNAAGNQSDWFSKMDTNGDGSVDKAEFTAFGQKLAASRSKATDNSDQLFSQIDTDGDGKLSKSEADTFITGLMSKMESMITGGGLSTLLNPQANANVGTNTIYKSDAQAASQPASSDTQPILNVLG